MFDEYYLFCRSAVLAVAPYYRPWGWTAADCLQEAAVKILDLLLLGDEAGVETAGDPQERRKQVRAAVLEHLCREATGRVVPRGSEKYAGEDGPPPEPEQPTGAEAVDWDALVASAPLMVGEYLFCRVLQGMTWEQTATTLDVDAGMVLARIRVAAADWLLAQFESRKAKT